MTKTASNLPDPKITFAAHRVVFPEPVLVVFVFARAGCRRQGQADRPHRRRQSQFLRGLRRHVFFCFSESSLLTSNTEDSFLKIRY
ncbi:unnamed protein product [Amoebophrya sp. A120]|nr:unnamed protein product [Amoebophrya sp. A120]|eukprot:GSA120T00006917001.1